MSSSKRISVCVAFVMEQMIWFRLFLLSNLCERSETVTLNHSQSHAQVHAKGTRTREAESNISLTHTECRALNVTILIVVERLKMEIVL